jgi:hypothetical protein
MTQDLAVSADRVWTLIGGFNALPAWHPAVERSDLEDEGQKRRLTLVGGGTIVEKLVERDDVARSYTYSIEESPLPLRNYLATLRVHEREGGSTVEWSSVFEVAGGPEDDATKTVRGIYQSGFDSLEGRFGG